MQGIKNIQFTKLIKIGGQLKEFNFRKSNSSAEGKFTVDTIGERGDRIIFHMEKTGEAWTRIESGLPGWIESNENIFDSLIKEELAGSQ